MVSIQRELLRISYAMTSQARKSVQRSSAAPLRTWDSEALPTIDSTYTATHVDTRTSLKWYGDETVTTAYSVTDDFYKHWKLSKNDVYGTAPAKKTKSVTLTIDGVTYQGTLTEK